MIIELLNNSEPIKSRLHDLLETGRRLLVFPLPLWKYLGKGRILLLTALDSVQLHQQVVHHPFAEDRIVVVVGVLVHVLSHPPGQGRPLA